MKAFLHLLGTLFLYSCGGIAEQPSPAALSGEFQKVWNEGRSCSIDLDCTLYHGKSCLTTCGDAAVNSAAVEKLLRLEQGYIDAIDEDWGCMVNASCREGEPVPVCIDGQCQTIFNR